MSTNISTTSSAHPARPTIKTIEAAISSRTNNYNLIRLFLAVSVIYFHAFALSANTPYPDRLGRLLPHGLTIGGLAVDAFFLLSGLFVTQSLHRDPGPINFIIRRFCRIWPGYFVCLLVTAIIAVALSQGHNALPYAIFPGFYSYVLDNAKFHLTWPIVGVFDGHRYTAINGSIHTLPTEAKMYLLLFIAAIFGLTHSRKRIFFTGLVLLAALLLHYPLLAQPLSLPDYGQEAGAMFFLGVILFAIAPSATPKLWLGALCFGLAFITHGALHIAFFFLFIAWLVLLLGQCPFPWRPNADLSYGVYIYGFPCEQFVINFDPQIEPYQLFIAATLLALGFAAFSWHLLEHPAIKFGHQLATLRNNPNRSMNPAMAATASQSLAGRRQMSVAVGLYVACGIMLWASQHVFTPPQRPLGANITAFGPTETKAGARFNAQASGGSAIWITVTKQPPQGTSIIFAGHMLDTMIGPTALTALVPPRLTAKPGPKPIYLQLRTPTRLERSNIVILQVVD